MEEGFIGRCPNCGPLTKLEQEKIVLDSKGEPRIESGKCNRCGSPVEMYRSMEIECPHCGKQTTITNAHANWCTECGKPIPFPKKGESHEAWVTRVKNTWAGK